MDLFLVRHAESEGNSKNIMQGRIDYPLSREGIKQANLLSERLKDYTIDIIYTSSLKRALQTAEAIGKYHPETPLIVLDELKEVHIGLFTGLTWSEAEKKYPDVVKEFLLKRDLSFVPGAESPEDINSRIEICLNTILTNRDTAKRILLISHGSFLQRMLKKILGVSDNNFITFTFSNTSINELSITDVTRIKKINCTAHLHSETL